MSKKNKKQKKSLISDLNFNDSKILNWNHFEEIYPGYYKLHNVKVLRSCCGLNENNCLKQNDNFHFVFINFNCKIPYALFIKKQKQSLKFYINDYIAFCLLGFFPKKKK